MGTKNFLLAAFMIVALLTSCKKEEKGEKFSTLSVEENKGKIEDSGIKMVRTMDDMTDMQTIDISISMGDKLSMDDPFSDGLKKSEIANTISAIAGAGNGDFNDLYSNLKSAPIIPDDPSSIEELWNAVLGTYSWNSGAEVWDYTAGGDIVKFQFPSTETGTTNNAELIISDYAGVVIETPIDEEYTGDLPVALSMKLTVDGTTFMTYTYAASFNSEGIPSAFASDLTIEEFSWSFDFTNNDKKVSSNYTFTHNGETAMKMGGTIEGIFTEEHYEANTEYCYDDYKIDPETGWYEYYEVCVSSPDLVEGDYYWEETEFEEIIHKASANFQLFNIAIRGNVDIKTLVNKIDGIYENEDDDGFDDDQAESDAIDAVNEFINLRVIDLSANTIIAKAEAYMKHETNEWGTDSYLDIRFVFGDGSYVDAETYFNDGFDSFINEMNAFIRSLNAEYDFGIDEIDY